MSICTARLALTVNHSMEWAKNTMKRHTLASIPLLSALALTPSSALADAYTDQVNEQSRLHDASVKLVGQRQLGLEALTSDLGVERFSIVSGIPSFYRELVSLPGNSSLPVHYAQSLDDRAGWVDDVPQISTIVAGFYGVDDPNDGEYWRRNRCSGSKHYDLPLIYGNRVNQNAQFPQNPNSIDAMFLQHDKFIRNTTMMTPGGNKRALLLKPGNSGSAGNFSAPGLPAAQYATVDDWRVSCINDIGGNRGEGFEAIAPDGTTYTFDKLFYRPYMSTSGDHVYNIQNGFENDNTITTKLRYYEAVMLASTVEDVHGNTVTYTYDANGQVSKIQGSDGRVIDFVHEYQTAPQYDAILSQPLVPLGFDPSNIRPNVAFNQKRNKTTVTANNRTWVFEQFNTTAKLTLPDATFWTSDVGLWPGTGFIHNDLPGEDGCKELMWEGDIKHPNGSKMTYHYEPVMQLYKSDIPTELAGILSPCGKSNFGSPDTPSANLDGRGERTYRVTWKTLTLSNGTTYNWTYDYDQLPKTIDTVASIPEHKTHTVTMPDGSQTVYSINRDADSFKFGQIEKTEIYNAGENTPIQTINDTYVAGVGFGEAHQAATLSAIFPIRKLLTEKETVLSNGDRFTRAFEYHTDVGQANYSFGNPAKVTSSSNVATDIRIEDITYKHIKGKWILSLPETITFNGVAIDEWVYNSLGQQTEYKRFGVTLNNYAYHPAAHANKGLMASYEQVVNGTQTRTTTYSDYFRGTPRAITRPDGKNLTFTVDNNGWLLTQTDAKLQTTSYQYNDLGWLTRIAPPYPSTPTTVTYGVSGANGVVQVATVGTTKTRTDYDSLLRPVAVTLSDTLNSIPSIYTKTGYDYQNRVVYTSLPYHDAANEQGVNTEYDALGRMLKTEETASPYAKTEYEYLTGNEVKITDPANFVTRNKRSGYASPGDGNLVKITSPEGVTTEMTYDVWGNNLSVRQHGNQDGFTVDQTQYHYYDARFRLCRQSRPETGDKLFQYDDANQLIAYSEGQAAGTTCIAPSAGKVSLAYDNLGRLTTTDFPSGTDDITRTYDDNSNLLTLTRGGSSWTYTYLNNNWLKSETLAIDGLSFHTSYLKNGKGHLTDIGYPSGDYVQFVPDAFGRATHASFTDGNYRTTQYADDVEYHPNHALKGFTYGNGVKFSQGLNARQLPTSRHAVFDAGDSRQDPMQLSYQYDARANVTSITDGLDANRNVVNTYDGLSRLKTANSGWGNTSFTYDALGNLRNRTISGGSALGGPQHGVDIAYNSSNQVSTATTIDGTKTYVHDTRGNVTNNGTHTFVYDLANQPTSISGGQTGHFTYDGNLKRVKQVVDGKTIYSVYTQEAGLISQYDKTNSLHTDHIRLGTTTIARIESKGSKADTSTTAFSEPMTDETPATTLAQRDHYMPFGQSISGEPSKDTAIGFTGHIEDSSGLVYMQARYYDPVIGRFYSNDPVGVVEHLGTYNGIHGFNRYAYANNNPYKYTDPDGNNPALAVGRTAAAPIASNTTTVASGNLHNPYEPIGRPVAPTITAPNISPSDVVVGLGLILGASPELIDSVLSLATEGGSESIQEEYDSLEAAVGSVNPLEDAYLEGKTKQVGLKEQGFTEKWTGVDSDGVIQTAFKNPETGKFTGGHESSQNDKYW